MQSAVSSILAILIFFLNQNLKRFLVLLKLESSVQENYFYREPSEDQRLCVEFGSASADQCWCADDDDDDVDEQNK